MSGETPRKTEVVGSDDVPLRPRNDRVTLQDALLGIRPIAMPETAHPDQLSGRWDKSQHDRLSLPFRTDELREFESEFLDSMSPEEEAFLQRRISTAAGVPFEKNATPERWALTRSFVRLRRSMDTLLAEEEPQTAIHKFKPGQIHGIETNEQHITITGTHSQILSLVINNADKLKLTTDDCEDLFADGSPRVKSPLGFEISVSPGIGLHITLDDKLFGDPLALKDAQKLLVSMASEIPRDLTMRSLLNTNPDGSIKSATIRIDRDPDSVLAFLKKNGRVLGLDDSSNKSLQEGTEIVNNLGLTIHFDPDSGMLSIEATPEQFGAFNSTVRGLQAFSFTGHIDTLDELKSLVIIKPELDD